MISEPLTKTPVRGNVIMMLQMRRCGLHVMVVLCGGGRREGRCGDGGGVPVMISEPLTKTPVRGNVIMMLQMRRCGLHVMVVLCGGGRREGRCGDGGGVPV